jgi:hypothetical protein
MEPVEVGGTWVPDPEVPYEAVRLAVTEQALWSLRVAAPPVSIETGQGCRMRETHPGEPCEYDLASARGMVDGHCLAAAAVRAKQA